MAAVYRLAFDSGGNPYRIKDDFTRTAAPGVGDDFSTDGFTAGSLWLDTVTNTTYICESAATGAAVWHSLAGSTPLDYGETADITTLDYDDVADAGTGDEVARATHRHGMPSAGAGGSHYEVLMTGSAPPVPMTNDAETDWLYELVED